MKNHHLYHSNRSWQLWKPVLLPVMRNISCTYGFSRPEYPKVILAKLEAGYDIDQHIDMAPPNRYTHKIHVPIRTNNNVAFTVEDRAFLLKPGIAYGVNNLKLHGGYNKGKDGRIHFIFEMFEGG